jgi:hypothetical protein
MKSPSSAVNWHASLSTPTRVTVRNTFLEFEEFDLDVAGDSPFSRQVSEPVKPSSEFSRCVSGQSEGLMSTTSGDETGSNFQCAEGTDDGLFGDSFAPQTSYSSSKWNVSASPFFPVGKGHTVQQSYGICNSQGSAPQQVVQLQMFHTQGASDKNNAVASKKWCPTCRIEAMSTHKFCLYCRYEYTDTANTSKDRFATTSKARGESSPEAQPCSGFSEPDLLLNLQRLRYTEAPAFDIELMTKIWHRRLTSSSLTSSSSGACVSTIPIKWSKDL